VLIAAWLALGAGSAAASGGTPYRVRSSYVRQDAQQIVWHVQLTHSFSPLAMRRAGRELCLLIRRASNSTVSGVACVRPSLDHKRSSLYYSPITAKGRGRARWVPATVSRGSTSSLTGSFQPSGIGLGYYSFKWQVVTTGTHGCHGDCRRQYPHRPVLARVHVPVPVGCVPSGSPFVGSGPSSQHVIALTFDDGPWYDTPQFLDILEQKHVVATFFQIGEQISTYGGPVEHRMLADGDIIGDHTWSHPDVSGDGSFAAGQLSSTASAIKAASGFAPCLFRAPYGSVSGPLISEARSMGFITIQWDIDPRDWSRPGTGAIYSNVVGNAHNGAIVLQHDGGGDRSETLAALPQEIDTLRGQGYQFVTIPQLLGLRVIYK
jgi:peptidoglycan/xylan/chitin deacetylase (PgdA/CDA1 family)